MHAQCCVWQWGRWDTLIQNHFIKLPDLSEFSPLCKSGSTWHCHVLLWAWTTKPQTKILFRFFNSLWAPHSLFLGVHLMRCLVLLQEARGVKSAAWHSGGGLTESLFLHQMLSCSCGPEGMYMKIVRELTWILHFFLKRFQVEREKSLTTSFLVLAVVQLKCVASH